MQIQRKRRTKKLISLALALILMLALVPATLVSANSNVKFVDNNGKEVATQKETLDYFETSNPDFPTISKFDSDVHIVEVDSLADVYNGKVDKIGTLTAPDSIGLMTFKRILVHSTYTDEYDEKYNGYVGYSAFCSTMIEANGDVSFMIENIDMGKLSYVNLFENFENQHIYYPYSGNSIYYKVTDNTKPIYIIYSGGINTVFKVIQKGSTPTAATPTPSTPTASGNSLSNPNNKRAGAKLGDVLNSDIMAYINGNAIPSWNVDKKTVVVAEDLVNYGFDVVWSDANQTLSISYNASKKVTPIATTKNTKTPGSICTMHIATDIRTYISGKEVQAYNIKGKTLINIEDLGAAVWNDTSREIKITAK